jgi:hypothetical protein
MGTNTIYTTADGETIIDDDFDQYFTALTGDFVARNASSGAPEDATHSLGTLAVQWKNAYLQNLFIEGQLFDPDNIGSGADAANAIVSGKVRSGSGQPDFLRASGSGATMTILATATPLQITANGVSVTVSTDIAVSSLTVAPASQNTCLINDTNLTDQAASKYTGEHEADPIIIDTAGTEITNRIGQYIVLKASTEYMLAFVESATVLRNVMRGYFFDSTGAPIVRETLANDDTLTIMSLGWVFLDANGTTVDVSYRSPIYSANEPASPATDDYWFDLANRVWMRYDGADFQEVNRTLLGLVVIDGTNAVAARAYDFTKAYLDLIDMEVEVQSNTIIRSKAGRNVISAYAQTSEFMAGPALWDITTDLESGLTEANSTVYYLYITESGDAKISIERPYNREADLKGFYHPYHSWRYVGVAYNDGSGNFTSANSLNTKNTKKDVFTSSSEWLAIPNRDIRALVLGGGGGGGGEAANGTSGGTSTFHLLSATGGGGGQTANTAIRLGGAGGSASGGQINQDGGCGGISNGTSWSGDGGDSFYAGRPRNLITGAGATNGNSANGYGGGGGGCITASNGGGSGGGGGGCAISTFKALSGRYVVTVGGGGSGASGGVDGGNGSGGIVEIDYL